MQTDDDVELIDEPEVPEGGETPETPETPEPAAPPWDRLAETLDRIASRPEPRAPEPAAPRGMTPEQIAAINDKLSAEILTNPLGVLSEFSGRIADEKVAALRQQFEPYREAVVTQFVDRFKAKMADEDPLYKQVKSTFDARLADEDLTALALRPRGEQTKFLQEKWDAAGYEVLKKKVRRVTGPPPGSSAGGGRRMADPQSGNGKLGEQEKMMLYRSMPKDEADAAIREIEAGL